MYATTLPRSNWLRRASIRLAWYRHMPASSYYYFIIIWQQSAAVTRSQVGLLTMYLLDDIVDTAALNKLLTLSFTRQDALHKAFPFYFCCCCFYDCDGLLCTYESKKWALNHAAKCIHLQLVETIRVIHLVTEQRTGECNVINIHSCSRLVQRKTLNYKCHYVSTK